MKALVVDPARGQRPFVLGDWPDPEVRPGWALVEVRAAAGVVRRRGWAATLDGPFDAIVDSAGADVPALMTTLRRGGRLVMLGRTAEGMAEVDVSDMFWRQLSVLGTSYARMAESHFGNGVLTT